MAALLALCAGAARPATCLISFDAHPGNFLIRADGSAVLVDLEKGRYGAPSLDLAHATLYTSTTWDVESAAELSVAEIAGFYAAWALVAGVPAAAAWHGALRRAMWLWSVTWCAKWRVLSAAPQRAGADGEDWSAAASDDALIAHVRERVDHYLSPGIVTRCLDEFAALDRVLAG
jgi:thiamine kinase-like enzyme